MTPTAFVQMEKLPLSPNGKVDRNALPVPEPSRDETESFVGPRNPVELKLAEIWAEVLRLPEVSVYDFFRLGGRSPWRRRCFRVRNWLNVELRCVPCLRLRPPRICSGRRLQVDVHALRKVRPVARPCAAAVVRPATLVVSINLSQTVRSIAFLSKFS
jgi:hypothetical protein